MHPLKSYRHFMSETAKSVWNAGYMQHVAGELGDSAATMPL
jgi:hypothetical protein